MKKTVLSLMIMAGAVSPAFATDIDFTYNVNDAEPKVYGFDKKETYDVAININDPIYVGAKVKGFSVDLPVGAGAIEDISGWMSTELKLEGKVNAPDIESKPAAVAEEMLNVTFDSPYTITGAGVWVGYSFKITSLEEEYHWPGSPVACIESKENLDKGLWIHSSRSRLKWTNIGQSVGAVSTMIVHLETSFGPYDAAVAMPAQSYIKAGNACDVSVSVINHGNFPIQDITYSYSIGDNSGNGSVHLDTPIENGGKTAAVNFPIAAVDKTGEYPFSLTLETVNGMPNTDAMRTGTGIMNVWPVIPVTRPLVEEFTGLRCGYCPRGYVAMEWMKEHLGDMFVGMAFHSASYESGKNSMVTVKNEDFPIDVPGFPDADINRQVEMDPSYLPSEWDSFAAQIAPADVNIDMKWADSDRTEAVMTSTVTFAKDVTGDKYKLAFALVADGLKNDSWKQSNYYAGKSSGDGVESPLWDLFLNGGSSVAGLTFNDVVVYFKEIQGIENSIPSSVTAGVPVTYEYRVPMKDVTNISGNYIINDGASVHAVAILLDAETGFAVNCNKSADLPYSDTQLGIGEVSSDNAEVVATEYHNLQGAPVMNPSEGVYVRTDIMSDGTRRASKVILK